MAALIEGYKGPT